ncbi:radical SAM family heme chaperone HemW [Natronospora cellulosivora (SeqCode)]
MYKTKTNNVIDNKIKNLDFNIKLPLAIYLHVPFCEGKCRYCDFYSKNLSENKVERYIKALEIEIKARARILRETNDLDSKTKFKVNTIYIGGGTPSLLSSKDIKKIFLLLKENFSLSVSAEITIEANPNSLNREKSEAYKEIGINRISLGVQSFNDEELKFLGRRHNSIEALEKIEVLRKYFSNFNIDLIFAIPGQSKASWKDNLMRAISLNPKHISIYNLQIEEGTSLAQDLEKGKFEKADDSLDAEMYIMAKEILSQNGFTHYEISNFARTAKQSKHNRIYWELKPYLGLGPAAHSFTGKIRYQNYSSISKYYELLLENSLNIKSNISDLPTITEIKVLDSKELMSEKIFMGLRLLEGISLDDFAENFNISLLTVYKEEIQRLKELSLIKIMNRRLSLTKKGLLHANRVFMEFL